MVQRAHQPISNNDDWMAAATDWTTTAVAKFMVGLPLTRWEQRYIDVLRANIGVPPESPAKFVARVDKEDRGENKIATALERLDATDVQEPA